MISPAICESLPTRTSNANSLEFYLDLAGKNASVIQNVIKKWGDLTIGEYSEKVNTVSNEPFQPRDDFFQVVHAYVEDLFGEDLARRAVRDLSESPVALTANHHGVDYFAQSIQGSLIFALSRMGSGTKMSTVPVFACGNIPLNNLTFPLGLLIYKSLVDGIENLPFKLAIFPDRLKRSVVSVVPRYDRKMIDRALKKTGSLFEKKLVSQEYLDSVKKILEIEYGNDDVLNLDTYSQQAVVLNNRLWKKMLNLGKETPDLVYLEIEKIVAKLLTLDLQNRNSLAWLIMFDPQLRENILIELEGKKACWSLKGLEERVQFCNDPLNSKQLNGGCGTIFFWSTDKSGRKVALHLDVKSKKYPQLVGLTDAKGIIEIPFEPDVVIDKLKRNELLPSLFTSYMTLAFARGITCLGGYYQATYLPMMQKGLLRVLARLNRYPEIASSVLRVNTRAYLSGMQTVMTRIGNDMLAPAGHLEIISSGGLKTEDIQKIKSLTVREAHWASLSETIPDVAFESSNLEGLKQDIGEQCFLKLNDKITIK